MSIVNNKQCQNCFKTFKLYPEDLEFYQKINVPEPKLCRPCRMQRRLAYRNERHLYERKCSLTGKKIISAFSSDKPFPVCDIEAWWQDSNDAVKYGKDFDFNKPFFSQWRELVNKVPRLALQQQKPMENSEYCNCASRNKNCYLVFSTNNCEDCYYGSWVNKSLNCLDNTNIMDCELCYQCVDCRECYHTFYAQESNNCTDCRFIKNCSGCKNCLFCTNLVNQEYCVFNRQTTKDKYLEFIKKLDFQDYQKIKEYKENFNGQKSKSIVKNLYGTHNENSFGNYLNNNNNAYYYFECDSSERIRYCVCLDNVKDSMDYSYWGGGAELIYECQACGYNLHNLKFCNLCWTDCHDLEYCDHCFSCNNCFGCVGLKKKQYCLLNKQYSEEKYIKLKDKIIAYLRTTQEYGEFFPISMSHFAYNESLAQEHFLLNKENVIANNWQWKEKDKKDYLSAHDDILACAICGKNFKLVKKEKEFYQKEKIAQPNKCPDCRHLERMALRNPRSLWQRQCQRPNCHNTFETTYSPEKKELVYCEDCYNKEIY